MKNLLLATNIISLAVIGWLVFGQKGCATTPEIKKTDVSCYDCTDETVGETFGHFKEVLTRYRTERWDVINATKFATITAGHNFAILSDRANAGANSLYKNSDSRSIWFSFDTLKKFICTIEKYNNQLQNKPQHLGIRFYYAVYGNDHPMAERKNRHTLFLVPTFQNNPNGPQEDYDPRETYKIQQRQKTGEIYTLPMLRGSANNLLMLSGKFTASAPGTNTIQNSGELCPDNCSTTLPLIDQ